MTEAFVSLRGVSKSYDGLVRVVEQLDLDIRQKEFLTLLGPSGSGKTTILTMLAGFETPSSGEIYMSGKPISHVPPHGRNIGVVFQNYALFPHLTVAQNVGFPLEVRGVAQSEREKRVRDMLEMVGLSQHVARYPAQLSGGQQQRVALARALVFHPDLVLMDEPLGALDNALRKRMQIEIKALQRRLGVTVVFVTHDQGEALVMSDRVAVFDKGRIQQIAPPQEIYARPSNAFVAEFIGETSWFLGEVSAIEGEECVVDTPAGKIRARAASPLQQGALVRVAVRPEDINLVGPDTPATVRGVLEDTTYLGDHLMLTLRTAIGTAVSVKAPKPGQSNPLRVGEEFGLSWEAHHAVAFAEER
ncbi:MAG: ABC transporter ATP-binding protein [Rhizobiaceae bacterium]|nr:ABC transporter ATP-binding protein [Rhizobiaceae bacterium]